LAEWLARNPDVQIWSTIIGVWIITKASAGRMVSKKLFELGANKHVKDKRW
jgi:hypothetical protein